ncbi:MAG: amidohydrolase [Ponticaulis sp.]|nr:amidohydrolase [Ponticaulis sp.]|tara:strand:+ start:4941 stop:5933 length:993 start_codon:yes stop_codon:yes gene_type:complete
MFGRDDWLAQFSEDILEPEREIVDPHHHLWIGRGGSDYLLEHLWKDTGSGHNVVETMFMECHWSYRKDGPEHLKSVGETETVAAVADAAKQDPSKSQIAGIIAHTNLRAPELDAALDAHVEASKGLFRGIRHALAYDTDDALFIKPRQPADLYALPEFQAGVRRLGERGFTYDTWNYHHQIGQLLTVARAAPGTTIILDHFATPLGVGQYAGKRAEIFEIWKRDMNDLAQCPNVHAKLGGLAMPDNGWGYDAQDKPATSDQIVADQGDWYHYTIDLFGPDRCMFESNFPVDRASVSYHVYWNAAKKIAARYSEAEKTAMFSGTARKVYSL